MTTDASIEPPGETIIVDETGNGLFQLKVRAGSSTFTVDEPIGVGGLGAGPNPYDLLSAAIGACSIMTMRLYANRKKWPLDRVRVKVTHRRSGVDAVDTFTREIQLMGELDAEQKKRLLDIANHCPVHRTIQRGSAIVTSLVPPDATLNKAVSQCEHMRDMVQACEQDDLSAAPA